MRWETHTKEGTIQKKPILILRWGPCLPKGQDKGLRSKRRVLVIWKRSPAAPGEWRAPLKTKVTNEGFTKNSKNSMCWEDSTILFLNVLQMCRYWHHRSIYFGRRAKYRCAIFTFDLNRVYWGQKNVIGFEKNWDSDISEIFEIRLHPISETKFHSSSAV